MHLPCMQSEQSSAGRVSLLLIQDGSKGCLPYMHVTKRLAV